MYSCLSKISISIVEILLSLVGVTVSEGLLLAPLSLAPPHSSSVSLQNGAIIEEETKVWWG